MLRVRLRTATRRNLSILLLASLVALGCVASPASGSGHTDGPDARRHTLDTRIARQKSDVDDISTRLLGAQAHLDGARHDLADARIRLVGLRGEVRTAQRVDRRTQARLARSVLRLRIARADLARGRTDVDTQRSQLTGFAVSSYSAGDVGISSLEALDPASVHAVVDGMQDDHSVLNKQAVALQQLQALQVLLTLTEQRVSASKDAVAQQRRAAAANLALERTLEAAAKSAKTDVQARVSSLRADRRRLASAKAAEIRRLHQLQAERQRVEQRLRRIAERRARSHHTTVASAPTAPTVTHNDGGYLSYPVTNTYITSPYGMRMNPVIHVYELHDGTDFHADCGTPVYAAANGRVSEEYFNVGYGNRLLMDNGYVRGVSLATSYNHLTSYVAGVGQRVSRGQLIAYSGTTGFSTGCHLHFMVYVNGATVDPVTWL